MHNSVLNNGKITLFFTDTGRAQDLTKSTKLKKGLTATLEVLNELFKGKYTGEIKLQQQLELSLTLCGNKKIKNLNHQYRNKNKETDVLSFPMYDSLRGESSSPMLKSLETLILGDIVIAVPVAKKQAREYEISFEQEVIHLIIHGLLHLIGYDHELSTKEEEIMEGLEEKLVGRVYSRLGLKGEVVRHGRVH